MSGAAQRVIAFGILLLILIPPARGVEVWVEQFSGGFNDVATDVACDASENVFVTGLSSTSNRTDLVTIKYSPTGVPLWTNRFNESASGNNAPKGLAVDPDGNVVVAASCTSSNGFYDYVTIKYSNSGIPLWTNLYNGPGNSDDFLAGVAIGNGGTIFVTGGSAVGNTAYPRYNPVDFDYETVAYSNAGVPLWTNRYNGTTNGNDYASAIAVDTNGNVAVTGYSDHGGGVYDIVTVEYSAGGTALWTNRYPGVGPEGNLPNAIATDGNGNVLVTGRAASATYFDYVTLKYSSAGIPSWTNLYAGPGNGVDEAKALAVDAQGNVFVTGYSVGANKAWEFLTIKYLPGGASEWTNRYSAMTNGSDTATAIALDPAGNVIVTGISLRNATSDDIVSIAYSNDGVGLSTNRYASVGNYSSQANAIATDRSGNILIAGLSEKPTGGDVFTTIKYSSLGTPVLTLQSRSGAVVLSWANSGFILQSTDGIEAAFTNVPGATSPFTNFTLSPQRFYRLRSN